MKKTRLALTALMIGTMTIAGASFAEAKTKVDDVKIIVNARDEHKPSKPSEHQRPDLKPEEHHEPHFDKQHKPASHRKPHFDKQHKPHGHDAPQPSHHPKPGYHK
jgi:hypothetical protein